MPLQNKNTTFVKTINMATHNDYGRWGEQMAAQFLKEKGYAICHRNWRIGHRDLDIVALDPRDDTLVIVEVKTRSSREYAGPEEAVDWKKIRNLISAANAYVKRYQIQLNLRFDIVTVTGSQQQFEIDHIEDAFRPY